MCFRKQPHTRRRPLPTQYSKAEVHRKTHGLPAPRFEDSQMTSFSGLILLQALFVRLGLKERLRRCFSHLTVSPIFGHATLVLCLVLHLTLGYRRLRDMRYYSDDPFVMRTLGLRRLPDVATLSLGNWRGRTAPAGTRAGGGCDPACGPWALARDGSTSMAR
jgi:hypothetical protein